MSNIAAEEEALIKAVGWTLAALLNGKVSVSLPTTQNRVLGVNALGRLIITVIPEGQEITKEIAQIEAIIARIG